ncbi:hypothetical protein ACOMHN_046131 [Nucella lapillus]
MSRGHGELFLLADRKNRMERARLDRQLRGMDRECARNEFLIERQQRALVTKLRGVSMTTGHSDKGLPPDGPHDNVYAKSQYRACRLSDQRLVEWHVRERQLNKFLRQFHTHPRPASTPATLRPRPASSRSETAPHSGGRSVAAPGDTLAKPQPVKIRPATAVVPREGSKPRRRCASAVSFSSRTRHVSLGEADEEDEGETVGNDASGRDGNEEFQSRLRSLSMVSLPQYYARRQASRRKPHLSGILSRLDVFEAFKEKPMNAPLNTAEVIEKFKTSAKNYEDFIRTHSVPETKFFVTKDSVVMTDGRQQGCRELPVGHSLTDLTDRPHEPCSSHPRRHPSSDTRELASNTDRMSLSSVSSDDFADSVFLAQDDHVTAHEGGEIPHTALIRAEQKTSTDDSHHSYRASDSQTKTKDHLRTLKHDDLIPDKDDHQAAVKRHPSSEQKTVSCQSVTFAAESENGWNRDDAAPVPAVSAPVKTPGTVNKKKGHVKDQSEGANLKQTRSHSYHQVLHPGPCRPREGDHCRAHSASAVRDRSQRSPSQTPLMKRRQKVPPRQHTQSTPTDQSSVMSAMTTRPLLTKETCQPEAVLSKHHESVGARRPSSAKPPRPGSSCKPHPRLTSSSLHSTHPHDDPKSSASSQQGKDSNTDTKPTTSDRHHPDRTTSTSSQHNPSQKSSSVKHSPEGEAEADAGSIPEEPRAGSQWRRDLELEQPAGLSCRVSTLGTVLKAAMVFSKAARKKALMDLVQQNNAHTHEAIRRERLRTLQSRAYVLTNIVAQFPAQGGD